MAFTNSSLVRHTMTSPNKTVNRRHAIDTITIHCVAGQCTAESLGAFFANPLHQASSNYGIGRDGRVGMYVEEKDRSWCSSNAANDHRSVTIEVASDSYYPYAVTPEAYAALIDLVADICRRNDIKELRWSTSRNDRVNHLNGCNMTVHRDYAAKSCPGEYLYSRMGGIAAKVNAKLGAGEDAPKPAPTPAPVAPSKPTPSPPAGGAFLALPILRRGAKSETVKALQSLLTLRGHKPGRWGSDGNFGGATENALKKFQQAKGLTADGICGLNTWSKLLGL